MDLNDYRAEFPVTENYTFLSHAASSPLNRRAAAAVSEYLERAQALPGERIRPVLLDTINQLRSRAATLINATSPDEIALISNTAAGINTAALSLPLRAGDNVLVLDGDYPANIYPWMNLAHKGVLTKMVPQRAGGLDLDLLTQRIDRRTRVIALSAVMFATGFRNDLEAVGKLCSERGIYFVVDGIQALGALPIDVQACKIDFLIVGHRNGSYLLMEVASCIVATRFWTNWSREHMLAPPVWSIRKIIWITTSRSSPMPSVLS